MYTGALISVYSTGEMGIMAVAMDEGQRDLHALVDQLPVDAREAARRVLSALVAEGGQDTDPLSPEEEAAEEQGWRECQSGKGVPFRQARSHRA